ncbi:MAG: hypothetical protein HYV29_03100 [Ignavibacteriales bacterium]|nr:hypothetical protein [Ignavibacteriales bacterium]
MKNLTILVFSLLFVIGGCEQSNTPATTTEPTSNSGNIAFTFDKANAPAAVKTLTATLSRSGYTTLTKTINIFTDTSATMLFSEVAVGTWKVKVDAKDGDEKILYTGQADVIVLENTLSQVNLTLTPVSTGVGSVQINVTWGGLPGNFPKTYGGSARDAAVCAAQTDDGGYVVGGVSHSYGSNGDAWLVRTDEKGNMLWAKNYGGPGEDRINSIVQTSDKGFLFVGYKNVSGNDHSWIAKVDSLGTIEWSKDYSISIDDAFLILKKISDGSFLTCGYAWMNSGFDGRVAKISPTGDLLWSKTFGGTVGSDFTMNFAELPDNNILVSGYYGSDPGKWYDFWLMKLDANGNLIWDKRYGESNEERSAGLVLTSDGNIMLSGYKSISGDWNGTIMKMDTAGNLLWTKLYGNSGEYFLKFGRSTDNSIYVTGYKTVLGLGQQGLLMKIDNSGNSAWTLNYGGNGRDVFSEICLTTDSKFIMVGTTNSSGSGGDDYWLAKVNTNGIME